MAGLHLIMLITGLCLITGLHLLIDRLLPVKSRSVRIKIVCFFMDDGIVS